MGSRSSIRCARPTLRRGRKGAATAGSLVRQAAITCRRGQTRCRPSCARPWSRMATRSGIRMRLPPARSGGGSAFPSTAPRSGTGPLRTIFTCPTTGRGRRRTFAAGSASRSASSGSWTRRPTTFSDARTRLSSSSTWSTTAAGCRSGAGSIVGRRSRRTSTCSTGLFQGTGFHSRYTWTRRGSSGTTTDR